MASKRKTANRAPRKSVRTPNANKRGTNPKSLANLAPPFPKGVSGNPGGRPKLVGESYKEWLATETAEGLTNAQALALAIGAAALEGDVSAAREIRAATEGEQVGVLPILVTVDQ
jgi:hypothetical protein